MTEEARQGKILSLRRVAAHGGSKIPNENKEAQGLKLLEPTMSIDDIDGLREMGLQGREMEKGGKAHRVGAVFAP